MTHRECLIVFTRFPRRGTSKTRLAQKIGDEAVFQLHQAFLRDIFLRFKKRNFDLVIAGITGDTEEDFQELAGNHGTFDWFFLPNGVTMEDQIFSSYEMALSRYGKAISTASDIPHLSQRLVRQMFADLEEFDVVFHMNHDGGTCPQAMKVAYDLFVQTTERSTNHCQEWKDRLVSLGLRYKLAPEILINIDTFDDLLIFYHWQNLLGSDSEMFCPVTIDTIREVLSL